MIAWRIRCHSRSTATSQRTELHLTQYVLIGAPTIPSRLRAVPYLAARERESRCLAVETFRYRVGRAIFIQRMKTEESTDLMASIANALKEEISTLARREVRRGCAFRAPGPAHRAPSRFLPSPCPGVVGSGWRVRALRLREWTSYTQRPALGGPQALALHLRSLIAPSFEVAADAAVSSPTLPIKRPASPMRLVVRP